jgi:hypothetical protein
MMCTSLARIRARSSAAPCYAYLVHKRACADLSGNFDAPAHGCSHDAAAPGAADSQRRTAPLPRRAVLILDAEYQSPRYEGRSSAPPVIATSCQRALFVVRLWCAMRLLCVLALAGCAQHTVRVYSQDVLSHADELRRGAQVTLPALLSGDRTDDQEVVAITKDTRADAMVSPVEEDPGSSAQRARAPIVEMLQDCPAILARDPRKQVAAYPQCRLLRTETLTVGEHRHFDRAITGTVVLGLAFSTSITCAFACEGTAATVSKGAAITLGAAGLVALGITLVALAIVRHD